MDRSVFPRQPQTRNPFDPVTHPPTLPPPPPQAHEEAHQLRRQREGDGEHAGGQQHLLDRLLLLRAQPVPGAPEAQPVPRARGNDGGHVCGEWWSGNCFVCVWGGRNGRPGGLTTDIANGQTRPFSSDATSEWMPDARAPVQSS